MAQDKNIEFDPAATKVELCHLVKKHKPPIRYLRDDLAGILSE